MAIFCCHAEIRDVAFVMQVIHMDLKSKNILLNRQQTVAKVADVGLARGFNSASPDFVAGTREYSAPEVLLGRPCNFKVITRNIDVRPSEGQHPQLAACSCNQLSPS